mmetsp:Transcript_25487/g.19241  ORF Transcript_25487/g.19241 Transcript_25487/m.19241 type:complete len:152 (+) Transcript_25487:776-1231(+)
MQASDEVGLMEFYAQNYQKIQHSAVDTDLTLLKEVPKQAVLKCVLDINALAQLIDDLEALATLDPHDFDPLAKQGRSMGTMGSDQPRPQPYQFKQQPQPSVFDLAYKKKNPLSVSVAQTMNRLAEQKYPVDENQYYYKGKQRSPPQHESYY